MIGLFLGEKDLPIEILKKIEKKKPKIIAHYVLKLHEGPLTGAYYPLPCL